MYFRCELTPRGVIAVHQAFPWLGDNWYPREDFELSRPDERIMSGVQPVDLVLASCPIAIPVSDLPETVLGDMASKVFYCDGVHSRMTHVWGGPVGSRDWHENNKLSWLHILGSLTYLDQGVMVRYKNPKMEYILYLWGPNPRLTEATYQLQSWADRLVKESIP